MRNDRLDQREKLQELFTQQGIRFVCDEPLAKHTTFKIGGPAALYCTPENTQQLALILRACREAGVRRYLLGNGSNILFSDAGFDGVVVRLGSGFGSISVQGGTITAGAGALLSRLSQTAAGAGLTGLEFAVGIPGTVGGGIYMNAGAYGGELRDVLTSVTILDEEGREQTLPADRLELGYRTSIFSSRDWHIVQAQFDLKPGDAAASAERMKSIMASRKEKQPLEWPSAGSTFKRPEGAFAAALIEQCGLKGYRVGGAAVSEKHSGFVVNLGGATCADVIRLTEDVARIVQERTGYRLEREVRVVA